MNEFVEWLKNKEAELNEELRAGAEFIKQDPAHNFFLDKNADQRERVATALNLYDEYRKTVS